MLKEYPDVLTTEETSDILRISRKKLYELIKNNELKAKKIGSKFVISKKDVIMFLEKE